MKETIHIGPSTLQDLDKAIKGNFVKLEGEDFYKISHYDQMRAFFIGVVSHSNHWLYISSNGGLSAGRKNPQSALFPYYTDDKIHDSGELTGSKTILLIQRADKTYLWEPFSERYQGLYKIQRNIYKNSTGNRLLFEEVNRDLELTFRYSWSFSEKFGIIKKSELCSDSALPVDIRILDGMQNLLPYGVNLKMQSERSTLMDAYKKNELLDSSGLGLFLLSSIPVDKAEPSESLKATTVWQTGLAANRHLLSSIQLPAFRKGEPINGERDVRAERGAYFVESEFTLASGAAKSWYFAAEVNQGPSAVAELDQWIKDTDDAATAIATDIAAGTKRLTQIVAAADGLQLSRDKQLNARHYANVLFNVMRGGIFDHNYDIHKRDLEDAIQHFNQNVAKRNDDFFDRLPERFSYEQMMEAAEASKDDQLIRLCSEFLPLTFSRRHGDPSRPWNMFSIELTDEQGDRKLYYQGNWRDIFQNWEALAISYPRFIESMIAKFVNASTADGYNPYRVTSEGIDWEVIEEDDPWSFIGYWGDHQIIYLLRLMELSQQYHPQALTSMLTQRRFAYANVPYRIRDYEALLKDPQDTIDFDHEVEAEVGRMVKAIGADGKLLLDKNGEVHLVNLTEKLLVSLLAKLSNFIPEGGIWLNTQRPEWNDANNALVGNGISMVTLYYIRRFVHFCQNLFNQLEVQSVEVSEELAELFHSIASTFDQHTDKLEGALSEQDRRQILDELGKAGAIYRNKIYKGFSEKTAPLELGAMDNFYSRVLTFADHSIRQNQRSDQLFHSYNLLQLKEDGGVAIRYLYEMLEGQVAALSAGLLSAEEVLEVLQALRESALYRADQHSYILYPDRQLPRFEAKNNIPESAIQSSELLRKMVEQNDRRLVEKDVTGAYHFNGSFNNKRDLEEAMDHISEEVYQRIIKNEKDQLLELFESIFDHESFTGRSGTFFGYEGLGCIYWHMVSKLVLAVQENALAAFKQEIDAKKRNKLVDHYYDIRAGLGTYKTPENYGAFPFDAYSHTPGNAGAQQPGMTGQVKEDIISRFGELGVFVEEGKIVFRPHLLKEEEFVEETATFTYYDVNGEEKSIDLPAASLVFTYCQVPVIYQKADHHGVEIFLNSEESVALTGDLAVPKEYSDAIMNRSGVIDRVLVSLQY